MSITKKNRKVFKSSFALTIKEKRIKQNQPPLLLTKTLDTINKMIANIEQIEKRPMN
jgi:hypothetical protein